MHSWKQTIAPAGPVKAGASAKDRLKVNEAAIMDAPPGTPGAEDFEAVKSEEAIEKAR